MDLWNSKKETLHNIFTYPHDDFLETARRIVIIAFALLFSNLANSSANIVNISESSITRLINQPTITAIFRSGSGVLWIGTQHGLYEFDGVTLTSYSAEAKGRQWIPSSDIRAITQDYEGRLLVGTYGSGLLRWNSTDKSFDPISASYLNSTSAVTSLVSSFDGYVLIGSKKGISLLDLKLSRDTSWLNRERLIETIGAATGMVELTPGEIMISDSKKLYLVSIANKEVRRILPKFFKENDASNVVAIEIDHASGTLYVGRNNGEILAFNLSSMEVIAKKSVLTKSATSITRMLFHEKTLWLGTNNGLVQASQDLSSLKPYKRSNSRLSGNHITSLASDNRMIWIGTYQGLNTLNFVKFETFDEKNSKIFNDVLAFEEDQSGRIWVGTFSGLFYFEPKTESHKLVSGGPHGNRLIDQRVMTIAANDHELWLGYRNAGVEIYNLDTGTTRVPSIENNDQLAVTKILNAGEDAIWVASYNLGLYRVSESGRKVTSYLQNSKLLDPTITVLFYSKSTGLIVGTEKSIYRYDDNSDEFFQLSVIDKNQRQELLVLSVNQNENLDLLIGTKEQGLFVWPASSQRDGDLTIIPFGEAHDSNLSTVYAIEFDANGNIWCSTQHGLVKLDKNGSFEERYTTSEGLQGDDFNFGASFKDSNGLIYYGGMRGYSRFDPQDMEMNYDEPELAIVNIIYSNTHIRNIPPPVTPTTLLLTHKDYFVKFDFSVLDFLDPEKNQYRYKLEGFDPEWVENGTSNSATYTNLPAGDYVLRVQGANSAGVWNLEGATQAIRVLPPPWRTWWAYTVYSIVSMLLIWIGKRAYDSYSIERRAIQLARQMHHEAERADDEMQEQLEIQDDLVNSVHRRNLDTLQLMSDCISVQGDYGDDAVSPDSSRSNVKRLQLLEILEGCVYYQHEQVLADLHKFTDIVIGRLLQSASVNSATISTINEVSTELVPIEVASPACILIGELLENCFHHAFDSESVANYIHIKFTADNATDKDPVYYLSIQDNGLGIPGNIDYRFPETAGLGVANAMAKKLGGALDIEVDQGTKAILRFPVRADA